MLGPKHGRACDDEGVGVLLEGRRYCVGAPDAPTARTYLRAQYPYVAQRARVPHQLLGLQLEDGVVRLMNSEQ